MWSRSLLHNVALALLSAISCQANSPTISPTHNPSIYLRSQFCQTLDYNQLSSCSFVLCPNQQVILSYSLIEKEGRKLDAMTMELASEMKDMNRDQFGDYESDISLAYMDDPMIGGGGMMDDPINNPGPTDDPMTLSPEPAPFYSEFPTGLPTSMPSGLPTAVPTSSEPTITPTCSPICVPSCSPSNFPSLSQQQPLSEVPSGAPSVSPTAPIGLNISLFDSLDQEVDFNVGTNFFEYSFQGPESFCDLMRFTVECTDPTQCGDLHTSLEIFQSGDFPTIPKFSIGLVFNPTDYPSDAMTSPVTSYFFDRDSSPHPLPCSSVISSPLFLLDSSQPLSFLANATRVLEYDSVPSEGWLLVKWRTVSFHVVTHDYAYGPWAYSNSLIESGTLMGWVASEIHNSVIGFILRRSDEMYHFYSLKETGTLESNLVLEQKGSYPNLRSFASGFSDQHLSFLAVHTS